MAHIHDQIDFVVSAFIVHKHQVLLVHHKELDLWLPVGGHIELDEDPEQALFREIEEESGLKKETLTILSTKPDLKSRRTKFLYRPNYLDIHTISPTHKHIGLIYFVASVSGQVRLAQREHYQIHWFGLSEFGSLSLDPAVEYYAQAAISMTMEDS